MWYCFQRGWALRLFARGCLVIRGGKAWWRMTGCRWVQMNGSMPVLETGAFHRAPFTATAAGEAAPLSCPPRGWVRRLRVWCWRRPRMFFTTWTPETGSTPVPFAKVVSRWFDKRRGLALALAIVGSSVGAAATPPLTQWLISEHSWRIAYVVLGLVTVEVILPTTGLLLRESPESMNLHPDGVASRPAGATHLAGHTRQEAFRMFDFWAMVAAFFVMSVAFHACLIHLVPMLRDGGLSAEGAAVAASLFALGILVGRIATGMLLDHFFAPRIAIAIFSMFALAIAMFWFGGPQWLSYLAVICLGLAQGAEFDLMAYLVSRYFGLASFGEIYSFIFAGFTLGGVIGPPLMGLGYDLTGAYTTGLAMLFVLPLFSIGMIARFGPYPTFGKAD